MARDEERLERSQEEPIVGGLPDVPGILAAIRLTPGLGVHLRGLADELLVNDFPGATLERAEREMLATAVSAANDCFYCMDSHGAFATALLERDGATELAPLIDVVKLGSSDGLRRQDARAAPHRADRRREPRDLTAADVAAAHAAGATDADVQLAVLIAAAFSMYNRMVEGFRARTPPTAEAYRDARRRDRGARLQRPAGHVRPGLTAAVSEGGRAQPARRRPWSDARSRRDARPANRSCTGAAERSLTY